MENQLSQMDEVEKNLRAESRVQRVGFGTSELKGWHSGLLNFLIKVNEICTRNKIQLKPEGLPWPKLWRLRQRRIPSLRSEGTAREG